ncbi:MAG: Rieske (2Fe-2S) protein [Anditalea sp.]
MNRKEFIKICGFACIGGISLLESCAGTAYFAQTTLEANRILIKKTEFLNTQDEKTKERKFVLIKSEKFGFPICVYKINEIEYSALLLQCTHRGCELQPQGNFLVCPCHGSEFSNKGLVQNPPAEQNLQTFKTATDDEYIYIYV